MTAPPAPATAPIAISAFLRGVDVRARLLARVQAGALVPAQQALAVVARVFAADAGRWPMAQWPQEYWRLLLAAPHLRDVATVSPGSPLPGVARLPPVPRAAILLQLVAELDEATAAAALGMPIAAYQDSIRDALPRDLAGQPDIDVWRAWRAAAQRELAAMASTAADAARPHRPAQVEPAAMPPQTRTVRWLWLGVAACVLVFATTFFLHPVGRAVLDRWTATVRVHPLPAAAAPKARFDPGDASLNPDRDLLAAPREAGYARDLAMLAWLSVASADPRAADAVPLPVLIARSQRLPVARSGEAAAIAARTRHWNALPPRVRGQLRGQWQAWRALPAAERQQLRTIGQRWLALDHAQQQALRARFELQSADARRGWWLGPRLGRDWPRIYALFAFVDASEREAVLAVLRGASADDLDALARLAQRTPPEARAHLRARWLAQAPEQRSAWLQAQLRR